MSHCAKRAEGEWGATHKLYPKSARRACTQAGKRSGSIDHDVDNHILHPAGYELDSSYL